MRAAPKRIWIDTDCALGARTFLPRDVDDGYALAAVIRATQLEPPRFELLGISTTSGNTDGTTALVCVERLLDHFKITNARLVNQVSAPQAIAAIEDEFSLLALGPLTNPAKALALRPDLAQRATLLSVGSVLKAHNWRRQMSDLNIRRDRAAARCTTQFASSFVFPLDIIERLFINRERLLRLESSSTYGTYLAQYSQRWLRWSFAKHGKFCFPLWDLVAALYIVDRLAQAAWDSQMRLTSFDAEATWENFLKLLGG